MLFTNRIFYPFLDMENFFFNSSVKDMQPFTSYKQDNAYVIEVKTLGINPTDVHVKLNKNILTINGETANAFNEQPFNTCLKLKISDSVLKEIDKIKYESKNGLTYIYLYFKPEEENTINVERI